MPHEKKSLERNILDFCIGNIRDLKGYEVFESERPDFILKKGEYKIVIEHFRSDTVLNEHTDSVCMKNYGERRRVFEVHNGELEKEELDFNAAASDIETIVNRSLDSAASFNYKTFIDGLRSVFEKHAGKVINYKKNCNEVWFLIDVGLENDHLIGALENGGNVRTNTLPITADMLNIFHQCTEVSRVIVCSRYLSKYNIVYDSCGRKYSYKYKSFDYDKTFYHVKIDLED